MAVVMMMALYIALVMAIALSMALSTAMSTAMSMALSTAMSLAMMIFISVPIIVFGSTIIMKLIERFPVIVYIGAGLIAYTAGEMMESDQAMQPYLPGIFHGTPYLAILLTVGVVGYGWWRNRTVNAAEAMPAAGSVLDDDEEHAVERV